jgi:hypothetical protein
MPSTSSARRRTTTRTEARSLYAGMFVHRAVTGMEMCRSRGFKVRGEDPDTTMLTGYGRSSRRPSRKSR